MSTIYIPNSVGLRNFETLFRNNTFDFSDGIANLEFHPNYVGLHPAALAFYAALSDQLAEKDIPVSGQIDRRMKSIPFLQRMGFFKSFGFDNIVETEEHEEAGRFIPLRKITSSAELRLFLTEIDPILHAGEDVKDAIKKVFSEILRNVLEHSKASHGGNVCAVFNKKKSKLTIGISDAGIGIFNSMKFHHVIATHQDAILLALRPGITGTTSRLGGTAENAGAGLFITKSIAQATRNHFLVYSGNSYYKLNLVPSASSISYSADPLLDRHTVRSDMPFFQGTLIGIDINTNDTPIFKDLIAKVGDIYQLSVKKAKKNYYSKIRFT